MEALGHNDCMKMIKKLQSVYHLCTIQVCIPSLYSKLSCIHQVMSESFLQFKHGKLT